MSAEDAYYAAGVVGVSLGGILLIGIAYNEVIKAAGMFGFAMLTLLLGFFFFFLGMLVEETPAYGEGGPGRPPRQP